MNNLKQLREKVEQSLSIVDVARKLNIEVSDHNYALCPFHNDHKPSLRLFDDESGKWGKHFHCFACGAHGGMIDLVKGIQKIDYTKALKWLSESYGIQYQDYSQFLNKDDRQNSQELLLSVLDEMNNKVQLAQWANERALPLETLVEARIIYVKKTHNILKVLRDRSNLNNSHNIELLVSLGFIIKLRPKEGYKDTLEQYADIDTWLVPTFDYDHVLIPIIDKDKNIVGFAARKIDKDNASIPKYKYSYGFKRSENLYGMEYVHEQLDPKLRASLKCITSSSIDLFIVEGLMDVIRLRSLGFYAVGVLGSSLTQTPGSKKDQASLIETLAELLEDKRNSISHQLNCILFLDNDEAGRSGNLSAIFKLMELARKQLNIHINVSIPYLKDSQKIKDPDEYFNELKMTERSTVPSNDAYNYITKITYSILEYFVAYQLNVPVFKVEWDKLDKDNLRKSQLNRELYYQLKDYTDLLDITKINKVYLNNQEVTITHESLLNSILVSIQRFYKPRETQTTSTMGKTLGKETINKDLLQLAVSSAKSSYIRSEFSYDIYAFDKVNTIIELFHDELEELITQPDMFPLEPYTPALEARDGNNYPRLKTLPCPEDLVIQDLILLSLIDETLTKDNSFEIPCVIYHNDLRIGKLYGPIQYKPQRSTLGEDKKDVVVSFAYQFNFYAQSSNPFKSQLFRGYLDCWTDFNDYILNCVRSYPQGLEIFTERYDIKRYYDRIKKKHIDKLLHEIFRYNYERSVYPSDRESLINLILRYSYDYPFYAPDSGDEERWADPNMGIPQGPNLSAWLANALLFQMDKFMQDITDGINSERLDGKRIALYARYVDDIILVTHSAESLQNLENALRDELDKLDLSLSEKVDSISSYSRPDFTKFLYENKGLPGMSLGISDQIRSSISINRSLHKIRVQNGDRKDVLNILHYYNPFELYKRNLPKLLLKASVKYASTLKERDFVSIARFLWVEMFVSFNESIPNDNPILDIAQKLSDAFKTQILPPNELGNSDNNLGRFINALYHHRYLLISIIGLNLALSNKYHRNPLMSDSEQDDFVKGKEHFIAYAKKYSVFFSSEHYTTADKSISKLRFLLELYLRKTWQLLHFDCPQSMDNVLALRKYDKPILRRFESGINVITTAWINPETYSSVLIALYNELWLAKFGKDPSGYLHATQRSFFKTAEEVTLIFADSTQNTNNTDTNIAKYIYTVIPHLEIQPEAMIQFLTNRPKIKHLLCWDGYNIPFLMPSYLEIEDKTFIGLNLDEHFQVVNATLIYHTSDHSSFWDQEMNREGSLQVEDFELLPEYMKAHFIFKEEWKLFGTSRNLPFSSIVKLIVVLYRYIEREWESHHQLNSLIINSSNILYRAINEDFKVRFISKQYSEGSKVERYYLVHNSVKELYKGKDELQQLYPYSYVWRLGWALNDLYGTIQLSEVDFVGAPKTLWGEADWIDEAVLLRVLFDLKGTYWKGAEEKKALPSHIEDHIDFLSEMDSKNDIVKTIYLLKSQLNRRTYAVLKQYEAFQEFDYEAGLKHLSNIAESLFYYDQQMIQHVKDKLFTNIQTNKPRISNSRRSASAWILLSQNFASVLGIVDHDDADTITEYVCICRFRVVTLLISKLFILSSQLLYQKMGKKSNVDFIDCGLSPETTSDLQQIFRSIVEDGVADYLYKESVIMQLSMLIAVMDSYSSAFNPKFYSRISNNLQLLYRLLTEKSDKIRKFANLQGIEYPIVVVDENHFAEFVQLFERIQDMLGISTSNVLDHSLAIGYDDDKFSINCSQGNYVIPFSALITEKLHVNESSTLERNKQNLGKELHSYTEVYVGESLLEIDTISENLAEISGIRAAQIAATEISHASIDADNDATNGDSQEILNVPHSNDDGESQDIITYNSNPIQDHEDIPDLSVSEISTPELTRLEQHQQSSHADETLRAVPKSSPSTSQDNSSVCFREFRDYQRIKWESRAKHNRMLRIAFFQFEVDSTYRHPLSEICSYDYENKDFYKKPWKHNTDSPDNSHCKEIVSCAELFRQGKLKAAIDACIAFDVDLLILPEYSVRPETIEYIQHTLSEKSASLSVLCGTFRIPLLADSRYLSQEFEPNEEVYRKSHSSLLSLLYKSEQTNKYRIKSRGKKYRSEASNEFFRPLDKTIQPLGKGLQVRKHNVVNHILELICSECFILTSPIQHDWMAESLLYLKNKYDPSLTQTLDNSDHVKEDIRELRNAVIGPRDLFTTDKRKLLIVPSMTSRVRDFYNLGEQFILTVSGSMIFCNAVFGKHGRGGSCVISGESYHDKQDNVWVSQCDGPYGDVQPGIYQRGAYNEGALGQDEEALVMFDINPTKATESKPGMQAQTNCLKLVAHLPLVEYYPTDKDIESSNDHNCACSRVEKSQSSYIKGVRTHRWVAEYVRVLSDLLTEPSTDELDNKHDEGFSPNTQTNIQDTCNFDNMDEDGRKHCMVAHHVEDCPPDRVCNSPLQKVFRNMFGTKGNIWIEKKVEEFLKQQGNKQFLHSESENTLIPVVFLDFLLVDYSSDLRKNRLILMQQNRKDSDSNQTKLEYIQISPTISAPPFSKNDIDGYDD